MSRRSAQNLLLFLASLALSLFAAETSVKYSLFTSEERARGAREIFDQYKNDYVRHHLEGAAEEDCVFSDRNIAHPFLGWITKSKGMCAPNIPHSGKFFDQEISLSKDESKFKILVVGGSVAAQLARGNYHGKVWLEEALNRDYKSPTGKPFSVIIGANGAWKFPAQNIAVILAGRRVDAVIAVDGFNEGANDPIDHPDVSLLMRLSRDGREDSHWINFRTLRLWRNLSLGNALLRHSFLAAAIHRYQISQVTAHWFEAKSLSPYANYGFPTEASAEDRLRWNLDQLKYYIRLLNLQVQGLGLKFAHFMQPIPGLYKPLTKDEERRAAYINKDRYLALLKANDELAKEGIATYSLARIFENYSEEIYADEVHCKFDAATGDSPGYALISEQIAKVLAKEWRLRRK